MKYILQFYTGSGNTAAFRAEEIIRKVEALTSGMAVSGVIIGQLRAAGRVPCRIYPGIEVNYDERLVRTDPAYIRESLAAAGELGLEGAVLSWNVLQAPEANLEAAASVPG